MLNREDSKVQILHIQKLLMSQGKDKKSGKKALAALSLKPVVEELLKLNDIETWLVTQRVRFMNKPMTKRILDMQSSRDALKADKKKSLTRLRRLLRDPKFEENQSILDIDLSPYLGNLWQKQPQHIGLPQIVPTQSQPSDDGLSSESTLKTVRKKILIYRPYDPAHEVVAKAVRAVGTEQQAWQQVVAYIDTCLVGEIPIIVPSYCNSLPQDKRPFLAQAMKQTKVRDRVQKIIREVKAGIGREQSPQQPTTK